MNKTCLTHIETTIQIEDSVSSDEALKMVVTAYYDLIKKHGLNWLDYRMEYDMGWDCEDYINFRHTVKIKAVPNILKLLN